MLFGSQKIKQYKSVSVLVVCHFLTSQSWRDKWHVSWLNNVISRLSSETKPRPKSWPTLSIVWSRLYLHRYLNTLRIQVVVSSSSACPPAVCTELTKYVVMNAVDIALSCARRTAAQRTPTDDKQSLHRQTPDHQRNTKPRLFGRKTFLGFGFCLFFKGF